MSKHEKPSRRKTGAKAEREQDQATVDTWFGTEDASTVTTGWEPKDEPGEKKG